MAAFTLPAQNAGSISDSLAFVNAPWKITDLGKGARAGYAQINMFNSVPKNRYTVPHAGMLSAWIRKVRITELVRLTVRFIKSIKKQGLSRFETALCQYEFYFFFF